MLQFSSSLEFFKEDLIRRFTQQIIRGVCYLHSHRIIHRDIKGGNVLVTGQGVAKLADFGCSKQLQGMQTQHGEDSSHVIRGSVPWMAPEVIKQTGHGRSADIWSVGATVIEMASASHPWPAFSNNLAFLFHVATASEPPPIPEILSDDVCSKRRNRRRTMLLLHIVIVFVSKFRAVVPPPPPLISLSLSPRFLIRPKLILNVACASTLRIDGRCDHRPWFTLLLLAILDHDYN